MHPKLEITYTSSATFPDYESFEFDDTKWENTDGDNLDWEVHNGSTPSGTTGPSSAKQGKYYAYVEASSPNYPSKTAYLLSPTYELDDKDNATLSFDYHMYGTTMGQLDLYVSTNDGSSWSSSVWSKSGNQGNSWNEAEVDLSTYLDETILLRFKATTGSSYSSDIALDNIRVNATTEANPDDTENYIVTTTSMSDQGTSGAMQHTVQYFDGLGRPVQEIGVGISLGGKDMVKPMEYDNYGRTSRNYLPFAAGDEEYGTFRDYETSGDDVLGLQEDFFLDHFSLPSNDTFAYAFTVYEESPLNRVLEQGAPGLAFSPDEVTELSTEHVQEFEYGVNAGSSVRCFTVNASTGALQNSTSYYAASTLYKVTFSDEDENETEEFKDKLGQVVLKRTFEGSNTLSTYYVYDNYGLLRYVIPPKAMGDNGLPTTTVQDQLCYYYEYDGRNRMIEKKLPGVDPVYMIYDTRDRLVLVQDGELRNDSDWMITIYDELNRPVISGLWSRSGFTFPTDISTIENYTNFQASWNYSNHYYSYQSSTIYNETTAQSKSYYDDYDLLSSSYFSGLGFDNTDNIDSYQDNDGTSNGYFDQVHGQLTGSATRVLDAAGSNWINTVNYYDDKYRMIQTQTTLYPQGTGMISIEYDFIGNVMQSIDLQYVNSVENIILYTFTYDHVNRLKDTYVHYNTDDAIVLAQNHYDELGQLKKKKLHSDDNSDFTQTVDYAYNIRGWLSSINDPGSLGDDSFGMKLFYQDVTGSPGTTARYNGNITGISWVHDGGSIEGYAFVYDELNRLEAGDYKTYSGSSWTDPTYFETSYSYDLNGNISALSRKNGSGTTIDNLTYTYVGNQLDYINDAGTTAGVNNTNSSGTDYTYDDNGNMQWDKNKDIEIDYNYLNLPEKIEEESGTGDELLYIYDANGTKWLKKLTDGSTITKTMYAGSFVYEDIDNDAIDDFGLDFILNPEGKIDKLTSSVEYHYHLKDHLGNTRVLFDGAGTVKQKTDYYPFGMTSYQSSSSNDNKYLYNGKELQDEMLGSVNLDWYDYGARFYDPALGRWHTQDPLAEDYLNLSPYNYVANNPIIFIDPNGMNIDGYTIDEESGEIERQDDTGGKDYDVLYRKDDYEAAKASGKTNSDGNPEPENQVTVTDTEILPALESNSQATSISNSNDAFNVFKFAADNSNVEWGLVGYGNNGGNQYALYTDQDSENLTMPHYALDIDNIQSFLHSHPGAGTDAYSENISMGKYVRPDNGQVQAFRSSDWGYKRRGLLPYKTAVYFPRSKNVYQIKQNSIVSGGKFNNYK